MIFKRSEKKNFYLILGTTLCLVFTSLAGIGVTLKLSAVHRLVIDTGRSILVWAISLGLDWQTFQPLQIIGFFIILLGVLIFNDIFIGTISLL